MCEDTYLVFTVCGERRAQPVMTTRVLLTEPVPRQALSARSVPVYTGSVMTEPVLRVLLRTGSVNRIPGSVRRNTGHNRT